MTNKTTKSLLVLAASGLSSSEPALPNKTVLPAPALGKVDPAHPRVNQANRRETRQQARIAQGVKNGQLAPGETRRLERGEQRLENREKKDMAKNNDHLTKQDQLQLNREANRMNRRIYKDKHNAKTN
jgi:hypothetical protein